MITYHGSIPDSFFHKAFQALKQISITAILIHGQLPRKAIALERPWWWLARGHWAFYQFQLGTSTTRNRELRAGALFGQSNRVYHWGTPTFTPDTWHWTTRKRATLRNTMCSVVRRIILGDLRFFVRDQKVKRGLRGTCTLMVQTSIDDYHQFGWEVVMNPKYCNSLSGVACFFEMDLWVGRWHWVFWILLGKEWYLSEIMTNTMIMRISMSLDLHMCSVHLMRSIYKNTCTIMHSFLLCTRRTCCQKEQASDLCLQTNFHNIMPLWDSNLPQDTPLGLQRGFRRQI